MYVLSKNKKNITMYVLSKNKKNITIFHLKIIIFTAVKNCSILYGRVFVMTEIHGQKGKYNEADNIVASLELCYHDFFSIFYSVLCIFLRFYF